MALLPRLAPTGSMAYVIAQHMAQGGHSDLMLRLLNQHSRLRVVMASEGMQLQPDYIYLIPAGKDGLARGNCLHLQEPTSENLSSPSVNILFASLAEAYGQRAIGIVLSGAGSDGAMGCRAIRAMGGITIAQDPLTALFDGMPSAAVAARAVDHIRKIDDIPELLHALIAQTVEPPSPPAATLSALPPLLEKVFAATGCDFSNYKEETLLRRLERRMSLLNIRSLEDYLAHIERHPAELSVIQHLFLVSLSSFFRDRDAFLGLQQALRPIIGAKAPQEKIRMWVPGCASGEEVYTLAIILHEILGPRFEQSDICVIGTDLNSEALALAREGLYPESAMKEVPKEVLESYFETSGSQYRVIGSVRSKCLFERRDVVSGAAPEELDLVSCRNLLIYMKGNLQDQLLRSFHRALLPHGLLFLGQSESLGQIGNSLFVPMDLSHKLYRRRQSRI
ncbi:MAG: hypothetical protein M0P59_02855 [Gallionella sp.]|nr:hypothetical protein [Gallionella sp.]MCK9353079.1 hypothetical protein [Gallionella sp.]